MYPTVLKAFALTLITTPTLLLAQSTQQQWGQCGGTGYTGPTICAQGSTCVYANDWYSQCLPSSYVTTTAKPVSSSVKSSSSSVKAVSSSSSYVVVQPASSSSVVKPTTSSTAKPTSSSSTGKPTSSSSTAKPTSTSTSKTTSIDLNATRTTDIFATITGFPYLPGKEDVIRNATLKISNIQCDILIGMRKKLELFLFFQIQDVPTFKKYFHAFVLPKITSVEQCLDVSTQPLVLLNVAFAQRGLYKLGINDNPLDTPFTQGQAANANNLGDDGTTNWVPEFTSGKIDGVFILASDQQAYIDAFKNWLLTTGLTSSGVLSVYELPGHIRPPPYDGHEMFGFLDGVGQPAVAGFDLNPEPGQQIINAGVILDGEFGDTLASQRPAWMFDGSFLAFRQLKQLVPEWDKWLLDKAPAYPGYTQQQNADLLGARLIGRWKSGNPIDLSPTFDNGLNLLPNQINNFDFNHPSPFNLATDQTYCPFASHIRKSRPRADQNTPLNAIMRAGIPYGPEVNAYEAAANKTDPDLERGLAFVGYQSQLNMGFQFIQTQWANTVNFPPGKSPTPGYDIVFGQNNGGPRWLSGADPNNQAAVLNFPTEFVVSRGGEYFFAPSISALGSPFSV